MLTSRGRVIFALGFGVYVAAWAFGSKPLYPVATGLLLVIGVAWVWVPLKPQPVRASAVIPSVTRQIWKSQARTHLAGL